MPVLETVSLGYKIGERLNVWDTNRNLVNWVLKFDYVWFDFSDWSNADLNSTTTSYVFGIPHGTVTIKADDGVWKLNCTSTSVGSDVVFLYKWCRANAPGASESQRSFRFEGGRYAGEGQMTSKYMMGAVALVGLGLMKLLG